MWVIFIKISLKIKSIEFIKAMPRLPAGQLSLDEIRNLVRQHNKMTTIKGVDQRKRADLIADIHKLGYSIDHENKKLYRTKKGTVDMRSKNNRTEKQIENSKRLVELNKKRAADRKLQKEKKMKQIISNEVKDSMIDIVTKPIQQVKKERQERKPVISPEQQKEYEYKQHKNLFC